MNPTANLALSRYQYGLDRTSRSIGPGGKVIDMGAGSCTMREPIQDAGFQWAGYDLNPSSPHVRQWDFSQPCPDEPQADLVLMLDVIEHCMNPGAVLRNAAAILAPAGKLVLTTPNPKWSRSRISAVFTGYLNCFTQSDLDLNGHVFTPWPHIMKHLLTVSGFEIEEYVTLDGWARIPQGKVTHRYPLRLANALLFMTIEKFDHSACGMSYGILARRAT